MNKKENFAEDDQLNQGSLTNCDDYYSFARTKKSEIWKDHQHNNEIEEKQIKQNKLLDFEPVLLEIKTISETFFLLQEVINYKNQSLDRNSGIAESVQHFAKASLTFKIL